MGTLGAEIEINVVDESSIGLTIRIVLDEIALSLARVQVMNKITIFGMHGSQIEYFSSGTCTCSCTFRHSHKLLIIIG